MSKRKKMVRVKRSRAASSATTASAAKPPRPRSKQAKLIDLLRAAKGATIEQLAGALGWQAHTVRGAISGSLKKKLSLAITSEKGADGTRVYRIA